MSESLSESQHYLKGIEKSVVEGAIKMDSILYSRKTLAFYAYALKADFETLHMFRRRAAYLL